MRPLGVYLIGISIYILNMIHFLMILGHFGVFFKMLTNRRTDGQTDRPSHRNATTHLTMKFTIDTDSRFYTFLTRK